MRSTRGFVATDLVEAEDILDLARAGINSIQSRPSVIAANKAEAEEQCHAALVALEAARVAFARMENGMAVRDGGTINPANNHFARATSQVMNAVRLLGSGQVPAYREVANG